VSGAESTPVMPGDPPVQPTIVDPPAVPPAPPEPGRQDPRPPPERPLVVERADDAAGHERDASTGH